MIELEKEKLKNQMILKSLATESPLALAMLDDLFYETPKHIEFINGKLMQLADGEIDRLMVFTHPRSGKSSLCSHYFPAWYLGTHKNHRVILTSYESDFASSWGRKVRDTLKQYRHIYGVEINEASSASYRWDFLKHKGGMVTAGTGGPITGKGADLLIIDDPVKDADHANSEAYRQRAKDWFRSTAYTRLTSDGRILFIQTRWHEDDLGGWILENYDDAWEVVRLPALAEENDILGRKEGEAMWPSMWNEPKLLERKRVLGEYWFSAMYQQRPQPAEGGILKRQWLRYYNPEDYEFTSDFSTFTGWDLAISQKETADYTCSCTVKKNERDLYIVDWTREHLTFPEQQNQVIEQQNRWNSDLIGIESNAYQAALPQSLHQQNLPIKSINRVKDKVTRMTSTFTAFEQGKVFLPQNHPMIYEFENEYVHFPTGKHDDLLDATEMAIKLAIGLESQRIQIYGYKR